MILHLCNKHHYHHVCCRIIFMQHKVAIICVKLLLMIWHTNTRAREHRFTPKRCEVSPSVAQNVIMKATCLAEVNSVLLRQASRRVASTSSLELWQLWSLNVLCSEEIIHQLYYELYPSYPHSYRLENADQALVIIVFQSAFFPFEQI